MNRFVSLVVSLAFLSCAHVPNKPSASPGIKCNDFPDKQATADYEAVGQIIVDGTFACTATLIRSNVIVTAAHCVRDWDMFRKSHAVFYAGGKVFHVTDVVADDPDQSAYDIAFAKLYEKSTIKPIPLAGYADLARFSGKYTFVGYGCTSACYSEEDNDAVFTGFKGKHKVTVDVEDMTMLAGVTTKMKLCPGDSGGPVIEKNTGKIVGIASHYYSHNGKVVLSTFAVTAPYKLPSERLFPSTTE